MSEIYSIFVRKVVYIVIFYWKNWSYRASWWDLALLGLGVRPVVGAVFLDQKAESRACWVTCALWTSLQFVVLLNLSFFMQDLIWITFLNFVTQLHLKRTMVIFRLILAFYFWWSRLYNQSSVASWSLTEIKASDIHRPGSRRYRGCRDERRLELW